MIRIVIGILSIALSIFIINLYAQNMTLFNTAEQISFAVVVILTDTLLCLISFHLFFQNLKNDSKRRNKRKSELEK